MTTSIWSNTNTVTVTATEGEPFEVTLDTSFTGITNPPQTNFFIVSGTLPAGLKLVHDRYSDPLPTVKIIGTPATIKKTKGFEVTVRGIYNNIISDKIVGIIVEKIPLPDIWITTSGYDFGVINERKATSIPLPIDYSGVDSTAVTLNVISGSLPPGFRLEGDEIIGVPFEVANTKQFTFVIRAEYGDVITDRTFYISIAGPDAPVWQTPGKDVLTEVNVFDPTVTYYTGNIIRYQGIYYRVLKQAQNIIPPNTEYFYSGIEFTEYDPEAEYQFNSTILYQDQLYSVVLPVSGITPPNQTYYKRIYQNTKLVSNSLVIVENYDSNTEYIKDTVIRSNGVLYKVTSATVQGITPPNKSYYSLYTPANPLLPVGANETYYILDNTYIDFQLEATDNDILAGETLKYYIASNDGELPPGIVLTDTGRLVGWVQPVLRVGKLTGYYDTSVYDSVAFDFGYKPSNGYDTFNFDVLNYQYSTTTISTRQLNRNYEFVVTITDGFTSVKRQFMIYVVGNDFFRADTVVIEVSTGVYRADASYLRAPIWTTPQNLGVKRANNYLTVQFEIYKTQDVSPVVYNLDQVNPLVYGTTIKTNVNENRAGKNLLRINNASGVPRIGQKISFKEYIPGAISNIYTINQVQAIGPKEYVLTLSGALTQNINDSVEIGIGTESVLPPGTSFNPYTSNLLGYLPYQTATTKTYQFTLSATRLGDTTENATSRRTFTISIIGEIERVIQWITDPDLGTIEANIPSTLSVSAVDIIANGEIFYRVIGGSLPPGLSLNLDGQIIGKVNQFYREDINLLGLTRIFDTNVGDFTLDFGNTTIDTEFEFTIEAKDLYKFTSITRTFKLKVQALNDRYYSDLIVKPYLKPEQRTAFQTFITDSSVFDTTAIYRPNDSNFGIQKDLKMLVFAGIETKHIDQVVSVIGRNHAKKRFILGDVKIAEAKVPGTNNIVYEVIYIDVLDPLEIGKKHLAFDISTSNNPQNITVDQTADYYTGPFNTPEHYWTKPNPFLVTTDRNDMYAGDSGTRFKEPSSISLWRKRIRELGLNDRHYLPLWMRTVQTGSITELDYVSGIPLCYCKPGRAKDILLNIKNRNFNFKQIDYVIDRYTIDKYYETENSVNTIKLTDKYIVFRNDRTIIT